MADDKRKAPDSAESAGRRRPPPTIDLTAKEIRSETRSAPAEPPPYQPDDPVCDSMADAPAREFRSGAGESERSGAHANSPSGIPARSRWPFIAAGLAGGILVTALLSALWFTGLVPGRDAGTIAMRTPGTSPETKLREPGSRPQPAPPVTPQAAPDSKIIDGINARLSKIEQALDKIPVRNTADSEKLAAIDNTLKALGLAIAGLNRRADDIAASTIAARNQAEAAGKTVGEMRTALNQLPPAATRADVEALTSRIAALEEAAKTSSQNSASTVSASAAVRLALSAIALREAATGGTPYAAELAMVKASGGDAAALVALEPFAVTGIPGDAVLARELAALLPRMISAAGVKNTADGGFLGKLQANAEKLVRVRPVNEAAGNDPMTIMVRIEAMASQNNVSGVRSEIAKLPPGSRQAADGWLKKLDARDAALAAARALAANAVKALATP